MGAGRPMFTTQVTYFGIFKYSLTQFWWQVDNRSNYGLIRGSDPLRMRVRVTSPGKPLSQKRWGGKEPKMVMRRGRTWILKPTAVIACPSYSSRLYQLVWDWWEWILLHLRAPFLCLSSFLIRWLKISDSISDMSSYTIEWHLLYLHRLFLLFEAC